MQFVPYELILIPGLIVLAALTGYLPAMSAYRTDVGKALSASPVNYCRGEERPKNTFPPGACREYVSSSLMVTGVDRRRGRCTGGRFAPVRSAAPCR